MGDLVVRNLKGDDVGKVSIGVKNERSIDLLKWRRKGKRWGWSCGCHGGGRAGAQASAGVWCATEEGIEG